MSVLRTIVSSSRALITGAKDVARFREITSVFVTHGFGWVFAQLKLRRELQVEQRETNVTRAALGSPESGRRLVTALTELGPTFVKFGQILSTRPDLLPDPVITELTTLQSDVAPLPFEAIDDQLKKSLGEDYRDKFSEFEETAIASASIAQVHRAVLKDGTEVAVKVQRPGIRRKIESDLNIMFALAGYAEEAFPEAQAMDLRGVITGFAKSISQELDFRSEAHNIERFARNFEGNERVMFPGVHHEVSTQEVLTMEFVHGRKLSDVIESGESTDSLIETYFDGAYQMLFKDGFFHGDLHPGNVLVLDNGKLGILDCGMVGRLSPTLKNKVIDILHAVINEDLESLARTFHALAIPRGRVDYRAFEADVVSIAERYLVGMPLSEIQMGVLLSEIVGGASRHNVRMPTDFTMLFKAVLTTEGLARTLAPDVDPIELARPAIMDMVAERYDPERLKQQAIRDLTLLSGMVRGLPQTVPAVLQDVRDGKLALGLATSTLDQYRKAADIRLVRGIRAAMTVTLLLCGTYTLGLNLPVWPALGIPYLSALFYALAIGGAAVLAVLR